MNKKVNEKKEQKKNASPSKEKLEAVASEVLQNKVEEEKKIKADPADIPDDDVKDIPEENGSLENAVKEAGLEESKSGDHYENLSPLEKSLIDLSTWLNILKLALSRCNVTIVDGASRPSFYSSFAGKYSQIQALLGLIAFNKIVNVQMVSGEIDVETFMSLPAFKQMEGLNEFAKSAILAAESTIKALEHLPEKEYTQEISYLLENLDVFESIIVKLEDVLSILGNIEIVRI